MKKLVKKRYKKNQRNQKLVLAYATEGGSPGVAWGDHWQICL